jgi:parvulin-like peptidyl-prolyl isomerase
MFLSRAAYLAATVTLMAAAATTSAFAQEQPAPTPPQQGPTPQSPAPTQPAPTTPAPQTPAQQAPAPKPAAPRTTPPAQQRPMSDPALITKAPKLPAGVAAQVNGTNLTYDELTAKLKAWAGRPLLQQAVQLKIVEQEAKKNGVTVTPAELKAEIEKVKQQQIDGQAQNGGGLMTWPQIAERNGISDAYLTDMVRFNILRRKAFQKVIEKSIPSMDGQIKVAHILIPTMDLETPKPDAKPKTPEEEVKRDADAKARAQELIADINAKKITFEDAAKQFSADKGPNGQGSAAQGGALPYTGKNRWDPAFEKAAFDLAKPGDMTATPIKSQFGYHIIKLLGKGSDAPPAEKAAYKKEQLDQQMQNPQGVEQWMQYLMATAKINYATTATAPAVASKPTKKPAPAVKKP